MITVRSLLCWLFANNAVQNEVGNVLLPTVPKSAIALLYAKWTQKGLLMGYREPAQGNNAQEQLHGVHFTNGIERHASLSEGESFLENG